MSSCRRCEWWSAIALLMLMQGCASIDWTATARRSAESFCRSKSHCDLPCDPQNRRSDDDPACQQRRMNTR